VQTTPDASSQRFFSFLSFCFIASHTFSLPELAQIRKSIVMLRPEAKSPSSLSSAGPPLFATSFPFVYWSSGDALLSPGKGRKNDSPFSHKTARRSSDADHLA